MTLRVMWDWHDWSLSYRSQGQPRYWFQVFALKCFLCKRWTMGCREHRFCGMCEPCRANTETDAS